jgi:cell division protein FtsW (lipid II flippase)
MSRQKDVQKLKKALMRSNTRLLLSAVMIFQFAAGLLLALKESPFDLQALVLAVALPAATWLVSTVITKFWPVDRAIVILALLLCSVGILTLQDIAKSPITPRTQAEYAAFGVVAMFMGAFAIRIFHHWKKLTPYLMGLCLLALLTPWVLGGWKGGARNWINLLGFSIQPSEFMKPVFILALASGFSNRPRF